MEPNQHARISIPELIHDATELIKIGWDTEALAKDKDGYACPPESDQACHWCEWGAVLAVTRARELPESVADYINDLINMANSDTKRYEEYRGTGGNKEVTFRWNDHLSTKEEVVDRFENAERFVHENPHLAVIPKYSTRTFVRDD